MNVYQSSDGWPGDEVFFNSANCDVEHFFLVTLGAAKFFPVLLQGENVANIR